MAKYHVETAADLIAYLGTVPPGTLIDPEMSLVSVVNITVAGGMKQTSGLYLRFRDPQDYGEGEYGNVTRKKPAPPLIHEPGKEQKMFWGCPYGKKPQG